MREHSLSMLSVCAFLRRLLGESSTAEGYSGEEAAIRAALGRDKRRLQLKVERTLRRLGYEFYRLGRKVENGNGLSPDRELYVASDSPVWRLMLREIPNLNHKLSRVVAELDGIDYLQATAIVRAWQRPLLHRLLRPGFRGLVNVRLRVMEMNGATMDSYAPEDN